MGKRVLDRLELAGQLLFLLVMLGSALIFSHGVSQAGLADGWSISSAAWNDPTTATAWIVTAGVGLLTASMFFIMVGLVRLFSLGKIQAEIMIDLLKSVQTLTQLLDERRSGS